MKIQLHAAALAVCFALTCAASAPVPAAAAEPAQGSDPAAETPPAEQLIVFVQPGASDLAQRFQAQTLPELETLAEQSGVSLAVIDVTDAPGTPAGVGITPLIAYQNHRGRSIYQGRYETLDRIKNFVRTSRFLPQGSDPLVREDLPVWDLGRAKVGTPIKITPMAGSTETVRYSVEKFEAAAREAIGSADDRFPMRDRVELGRSDRLFYADFYPYLAEDGTLYLSLALFSQFHCHDPVWTLAGSETRGPFADAPAVFAAGYQKLADEIARLLDESPLGDGFDPLPSDTPQAAWNDLGLPLPPEPEGASAQDLAGVELVREWTIDRDAQARRPAVQFKFPAPLDAYSGEAADVSGTLALGPGLTLADLRGTFHADPASVTMGEPDLDSAIHATMLEVAKYPDATFQVERVETQFEQPAFGVVAAAVLHGSFTMKDQTIPLTVPVSVEAYLGDDGRPRLSIDGLWRLRLLEPFGIEGPPGEAPANDTLVFTCHLVFEPA
ncbi:MAG: YceI family protein [Planctomycetota bacterium]